MPAIAVSPYKGVAYARNFPDAKRIYRSVSPFGDLQIYPSSYMHFAPGLSDNAAFNLPDLPANAYVGMYIDGEGRRASCASCRRRRARPTSATCRCTTPMSLKADPDDLRRPVRRRHLDHGGAARRVARRSPWPRATRRCWPPSATRRLRDVTGDILDDPRVHVIGYDGRLYLAHTDNRYDVIDLSLANSVGLSNPGGFAIVEKYAYTREAMLSYMRALADGGILSVTLWNKEEPPKSILKLYATIAAAARAFDPASAANALFVASSYLSTTTVLYKRGGFTPEEIAKLRDYTQATVVRRDLFAGHSPTTRPRPRRVLDDYRDSIFGNGAAAAGPDQRRRRDGEPVAGAPDRSGGDDAAADQGGDSPDAGDDARPARLARADRTAAGRGRRATMSSTRGR